MGLGRCINCARAGSGVVTGLVSASCAAFGRRRSLRRQAAERALRFRTMRNRPLRAPSRSLPPRQGLAARGCRHLSQDVQQTSPGHSARRYYSGRARTFRLERAPAPETRNNDDTRALRRWPLIRQIFGGGDGTGHEAMSDATRALAPKTQGAEVTRSICPYCAVGCGRLVYHRGNEIVSIEGDPESPISRGHLCPKGAASRSSDARRPADPRPIHRAPFSEAWTDMDLETAMDRIADISDSRDRAFEEERAGRPAHGAKGIFTWAVRHSTTKRTT